MIDLHLSAFAPRWRFLYVVRIDAYYNHIESLSNEATSLNVIDRFLYFRTSSGIYEYDLVHKVISGGGGV